MEGEPLSHKDAVLLTRNPQLVLDGLTALGQALDAKRVILAVGSEIDPAPATTAARHTGVEVLPLDGGFIAGQETALVNQLNGSPPVPRDPLTRVTQSGVDGRPTLVSNAETLAQLAMVVRHGQAWFRSAGTEEDPGTSLFTVTGSVRHPGVVEAERGAPLCDVIRSARPFAASAVLVGGYHGAWVPASDLDVSPHPKRPRVVRRRRRRRGPTRPGRPHVSAQLRDRRGRVPGPLSRPSSVALTSTACRTWRATCIASSPGSVTRRCSTRSPG